VRVLVTGADGFIGRNLRQHLAERKGIETVSFTRRDRPQDLHSLVGTADAVVHLAGVNRPNDVAEFAEVNTGLTRALCDALHAAAAVGKRPLVIHSSSTQVERRNAYGESKRLAEEALAELARSTRLPVRNFRLPNVFGKWAKPNYNSAIATFCYNIARGLPIAVHDPSVQLQLVYIDDFVQRICRMLEGDIGHEFMCRVEPQYTATVGELAEEIRGFDRDRQTLRVGNVGVGLQRALYATYVSYLPASFFSYSLPVHGDPRGIFVEMLKTPAAGQFSFFTTRPGVTRGGHYHHTKSEKFLVLHGRARFRFKHLLTGEIHTIETCGSKPEVVDTIPGWSHDITNIGDEEMFVILWANEVFDLQNPDTYPSPL
jgi:UDP-2-acetamido-2,6-beta-L-arabino-hexul-4-ose reductase